LPPRDSFPSPDAYYATALHELGHWTGHPSRLDRDLAHPFGSVGYAKEELRAEIASLMVGDQLGIGHDPSQHAAYVKSWVQVLKEVARDADKIGACVLGLEKERPAERIEQLPEVLREQPRPAAAQRRPKACAAAGRERGCLSAPSRIGSKLGERRQQDGAAVISSPRHGRALQVFVKNCPPASSTATRTT
jgi:hypothetical protein